MGFLVYLVRLWWQQTREIPKCLNNSLIPLTACLSVPKDKKWVFRQGCNYFGLWADAVWNFWSLQNDWCDCSLYMLIDSISGWKGSLFTAITLVDCLKPALVGVHEGCILSLILTGEHSKPFQTNSPQLCAGSLLTSRVKPRAHSLLKAFQDGRLQTHLENLWHLAVSRTSLGRKRVTCHP